MSSYGADIQGSLGASSDNVFRGVSLSRGQPSLLADLNGVGTRWFGGLSVDTLRLAPGSSVQPQLIGYLGYQQPLSTDWSGTWSLRHYDYPTDAYRSRYDYQELSANLGWRDQVQLQLIGSPDTYAVASGHRYGRGAAWAAQLNGEVPLPRTLSGQLGIGYEDLRRQVGGGYVYWSAGLSAQWTGWTFALAYIGTDAEGRRLFGARAGDRLVGSVVWSF